jgi:hypothetical protein
MVAGDPVVLEHRELALGGPPAVAPHGREDEGPRAQVAEVPDRGADDHVDVGDPPAAGADAHGVAALDGQRRGLQAPGDADGDVGDAGTRKGLPEADHRGQHGPDDTPLRSDQGRPLEPGTRDGYDSLSR